ncbi:hypothetical protein [Niallia sp. Man26]|uniref:hypothetical protein n=1 Tax=Niallia sp. Man26 TaxID=2912824 RepID=UPI001EDC3BD3|nr:hypothetical protein [Niallia sp. Man26]UPO88320.1 hypothetical protein L8T27_003895 [Niallia sp. Man26]
MAIFIEPRVPEEKKDEYKQKFLKAYDTAWLWASDSVINAMSAYMQLKIDNISGEREESAFANCVLEMRKDILGSSDVEVQDYKFIYF